MKDVQPWSVSLKAFKIESSVVKVLLKTLIALWHRRYAKLNYSRQELFQRYLAVTTLAFRAGCLASFRVRNRNYVNVGFIFRIFEATPMGFRGWQRTWPFVQLKILNSLNGFLQGQNCWR